MLGLFSFNPMDLIASSGAIALGYVLAAILFLGAAIGLIPRGYGLLARIASVILVLAATWGAGYRTADNRAELAGKLAALRHEALQARADLNAAQLAARSANAALQTIAERDRTREETIRDLETKLATKPAADRCRLDPAGDRWLRTIAPD